MITADNKNTVDKRKSDRVEMDCEAIIYIKYGQRMVRVTDISREGIAFNYCEETNFIPHEFHRGERFNMCILDVDKTWLGGVNIQSIECEVEHMEVGTYQTHVGCKVTGGERNYRKFVDKRTAIKLDRRNKNNSWFRKLFRRGVA